MLPMFGAGAAGGAAAGAFSKPSTLCSNGSMFGIGEDGAATGITGGATTGGAMTGGAAIGTTGGATTGGAMTGAATGTTGGATTGGAMIGGAAIAGIPGSPGSPLGKPPNPGNAPRGSTGTLTHPMNGKQGAGHAPATAGATKLDSEKPIAAAAAAANVRFIVVPLLIPVGGGPPPSPDIGTGFLEFPWRRREHQ